MTVTQWPWKQTADELPPEHVVVEVLNGEHVCELVRQGNLWFFPDFSMYVYYVPRCWRPPAR